MDALQRVLGADSGITPLSLRPAYDGTQTAEIGLLAPVHQWQEVPRAEDHPNWMDLLPDQGTNKATEVL